MNGQNDERQPDDRAPMALALAWASRVITVSLEMVLPGVLGLWLDDKLGTKFLLGVLGFAGGLTFGIWHLVKMTGGKKS